jgi:regulator of sigma D
LDGTDVKCVASGNAADRIGHVEIERVWEGLRVRVTGILSYKGLGKLSDVVADNVQFFDADDQLPSVDEILDERFAAGVESVEYLKRMRASYE